MKNANHAELGYRTLLTHASYAGMKSGANDLEEVIVNLLTSIMHLSQEGYNFNLDDMLRMAKERFEGLQKHPAEESATAIGDTKINVPDGVFDGEFLGLDKDGYVILWNGVDKVAYTTPNKLSDMDEINIAYLTDVERVRVGLNPISKSNTITPA